MIVKSVKLTNFRNHSTYDLECTDETSLILGENGCGKTSVLEAIYILTRGKSFRATDPEILKRGTDFYRIELNYTSGETTIATYDGKTKQFAILDKKTKRLPSKNKYSVILFLPSDLNLITHAPSRRRDYFDLIFGELSDAYASNLSKYKKALRQRNEILKQEHPAPDVLFSWNTILARLGTAISHSRQYYITEINSRLTPTYQSIAENDDHIQIDYQTEAANVTESGYLARLEQNYQKDIYLGHTTFGIHRDDYIFEFNHKPASGSASRGETRSIILALKFIEAELIEASTSQKPLILLDDVFSELDDSRRTCLIKNFKHHQVILTSVEQPDNIH